MSLSSESLKESTLQSVVFLNSLGSMLNSLTALMVKLLCNSVLSIGVTIWREQLDIFGTFSSSIFQV